MTNNNIEISFTVTDIIGVISHLTQLLSKETVLMQQMKIAEVATLQEEKHLLTNKLEAYRELIAKQPSLLDKYTREERIELKQSAAIFDSIATDNYKQLLYTRNINNKVIELVTLSLKKHLASQLGYSEEGDIDTQEANTPPLAFSQEI